MPHSHHSHSGQFCKHASGRLEDVILEAIRQGFEVYGLTEHVPRYRKEDLYPEERGLSLDILMQQFQNFLCEAHRLKTLYASDITILVGLETEVITSADLDNLQQLLEKHGDRIEYLVGSVHHVNSIPIDFDQQTFEKSLNSLPCTGTSTDSELLRMDTFLSTYLDAQYELLSRFHPEIIGHFDLCRLYRPDLIFRDFPLAWKKLERNVQFAIGYGALFEVNAAAFRKGWQSAYPAADVMALIMKHRGRVALSDDSHGPHAVGLNYDRLAEYLRRVGLGELWFLKHSAKPNAVGRHVYSIRVDGNWWDHPFWHSRSFST